MHSLFFSTVADTGLEQCQNTVLGTLYTVPFWDNAVLFHSAYGLDFVVFDIMFIF